MSSKSLSGISRIAVVSSNASVSHNMTTLTPSNDNSTSDNETKPESTTENVVNALCWSRSCSGRQDLMSGDSGEASGSKISKSMTSPPPSALHGNEDSASSFFYDDVEAKNASLERHSEEVCDGTPTRSPWGTTCPISNSKRKKKKNGKHTEGN